jgi:hypothetical protein
MEIRVDPNKVAIAFLCVILILMTINSVLLFLYFYLGDGELYGLVDLFDLDIEGNVPTLYSAMAVLLCSALLALITTVNWHNPEGRRWHWLGLSLLFFFLGVDEGTGIHEEIGSWLENFYEARGALYFFWVVPYGIATLVLGLTYLKFTWTLPADTRWRFVTAGTLFVVGALGIEMIGAREADLHGTTTLTYSVLYSIEELLEMLGIVVFIHALLLHLGRATGRFALVLDLGEDGPSTSQANHKTPTSSS